MSHFSIYKDGKRIGTVWKLEENSLWATFNRNFPQYKDTYGTPEQVRWSLRAIIPGAKYEPLDQQQLDAWLKDIDDRYAVQCPARRDNLSQQ